MRNSGGQRPLDVQPTVPPSIRQILQLPETPAPRPRRPLRRDADGHRLPPGPAPPQSWLSSSNRGVVRAGATGSTTGSAGAGFLATMDSDSALERRRRTRRSHHHHQPLPVAYCPEPGSLADMALRRMVLGWEFQREYCQYYLYHLPTHLRVAMLTYLGMWNPEGVALADLQALLLPHPEEVKGEEGGPEGREEDDVKVENADNSDDDDDDSDWEKQMQKEQQLLFDNDPSVVNDDFHHLDLSYSIGRSLTLRELTGLLFPSEVQKKKTTKSPTSTSSSFFPQNGMTNNNLPESWEDDDAHKPGSQPHKKHTTTATNSLTPPSQPPRPPLLQNLTHLSLALDPTTIASNSTKSISWRHLLSFAQHVRTTLTHLSLAYWPEPSLTSSASKFASVVVASPGQAAGRGGRTIQYGGTGPYSHSIDGDWSEAVMVLRMLSKTLYGLEWLDLTGCGGSGGSWDGPVSKAMGSESAGWAPALWESSEHDVVDWVGSWGKVEKVVMYPGFDEPVEGIEARARYWEVADNANRLERHIRTRREGRGRGIAVESVVRKEGEGEGR